jgi:hypothetical protein
MYESFRDLVGLLIRGIDPCKETRGKHTCPEWDSNPRPSVQAVEYLLRVSDCAATVIALNFSNFLNSDSYKTLHEI